MPRKISTAPSCYSAPLLPLRFSNVFVSPRVLYTTFVVKGRALACFTRRAPFPKTPKPLLISASLRLQAAKVKAWVPFNYGLQTVFLISVYDQFCTNVLTPWPRIGDAKIFAFTASLLPLQYIRITMHKMTKFEGQ